MVSIDQVVNGLMIYVRDNLLSQIPKDSFKYIAGNVALEVFGMNVNKRKPELMDQLKTYMENNQWTGMFDIITPDGMVDIETLKVILPKYIQPEGFKVPVPKIGVFTIQPNDIDVIYNCIVNCPTPQLGIGGGVN